MWVPFCWAATQGRPYEDMEMNQTAPLSALPHRWLQPAGAASSYGLATLKQAGYKPGTRGARAIDMRMAILALMLVVWVSACEEKPLRPAYVLPQLHHWPQPYKGVAGLQLHVFQTGTVTVPRRAVYRGGSLLETLDIEVIVFAVKHPRHGLILIGTGLSRGVAQGAQSYLGKFRTAIGTPTLAEGQDILSQLESLGWSEHDVRTIILPDLRFSHTGELENFPTAQVVVSSAEHRTAMADEETALSLSDEYDGVRNWQLIDFAGTETLGTFRAHHDLFGDGSILLIDAPGATAGGMAILLRLPHAPVLICGNLAWTLEQARYVREPGFVADRKTWWDNAWRLKKFTELAPELALLPDHDWPAITVAKTADMTLHVFGTGQPKNARGKQKTERETEKKKRESRKGQRERAS